MYNAMSNGFFQRAKSFFSQRVASIYLCDNVYSKANFFKIPHLALVSKTELKVRNYKVKCMKDRCIDFI